MILGNGRPNSSGNNFRSERVPRAVSCLLEGAAVGGAVRDAGRGLGQLHRARLAHSAHKQAGFEEEDVQPLHIWACWCVRQAVDLMKRRTASRRWRRPSASSREARTAEELAWVAEQAEPPGNASWPTPAKAWAARAAAELARLRSAIAARAAAEALAWASENRSAFPGVRLRQTISSGN